jgi:ribosomal protein S18
MSRRFGRKKFSRLTGDDVNIDYKDLDLLKQYIGETGKIAGSRAPARAISVSWPRRSSAPGS